MDSFPAEFNLESLLKEPQQFDNTNPSLKEQRKRIYTFMLHVVPRGHKNIVFDMPETMTVNDRQQLAHELCACFPGCVQYEASLGCEGKAWFPIEDSLNPPASANYKISIKK